MSCEHLPEPFPLLALHAVHVIFSFVSASLLMYDDVTVHCMAIWCNG